MYKIFAIIFAASSTSLSSMSTAQERTFAFDATISEVRPFGSVEQPWMATVGESITGLFRFEAIDSADLGNLAGGGSSARYTQPYASSLQIGDLHISSDAESLELKSADGNYYICDCAAGTVFDSGPFDELTVSAPLAAADVGFSTSPVYSYWSLFLQERSPQFILGSGNAQTVPGPLDGAVLPSDVATWNSFERSRQLTVMLRGSKSSGVVIYAEVADFVSVPEPSSIALIACLAVLGGVRRLTKRCS